MVVKKRTRLSAEDRRKHLLDCARDLIQESGVSGFTMEALATKADVSNPLVYKYFDTRLELLQELWTREYERFSTSIRE
jgi:AcrR family transcriptional regulator